MTTPAWYCWGRAEPRAADWNRAACRCGASSVTSTPPGQRHDWTPDATARRRPT
jgi:hypothetical protein